MDVRDKRCGLILYKVKLNLSVCLIKYFAAKLIGVAEVHSHAYSTSRSDRFTAAERIPRKIRGED
jgi:hypothetical protein